MAARVFGASVRVGRKLTCVGCKPLSLGLFAIAQASLSSCNEPYSSHPPPVTPENLAPASSSDFLEALLAPHTDAAAAAIQNSYHALSITRCLSSPTPCLPPEGEGSLSTSYLVVFGSGRGTVRSRAQATADAYNELMHKTSARERLDVEEYIQVDGGAPTPVANGLEVRRSPSDGDPLAACAEEVLDFVDSAGEVTLDVLHESGSTGCMVTLGHLFADGGAPQCLVPEPEHPHSPPRGRKGIAF
jgi:hypothetical protein